MTQRSEQFGKHQRLLSPSEFQNVLRGPDLRKSRGPLQLLATRNTIAHARLGLIVPKRQLARAHDRNRVKRVVREAFRRQACELPSLDMVVRIRGAVSEPSLQENLAWLLEWVRE